MIHKKYKIEDYTNLFSLILAPILITNCEGYIEFVNDSFINLSGHTKKELIGNKIGKKSNILYSGEHDKNFYKEMWNTIKSGKIYKNQLRNKKKSGELYWQSVTISPIEVKDSNGLFKSYFLAIIDDITKTRNAALKLSALLETIGQDQEILIFNKNRELVEVVGSSNYEEQKILLKNLNIKLKNIPIYNNNILTDINKTFDKIDVSSNKSYIRNYIFVKKDKNLDLEILCRRFNSTSYMVIIKDITNSRDFIKVQLGISKLEEQISRLIKSKTNNKY